MGRGCTRIPIVRRGRGHRNGLSGRREATLYGKTRTGRDVEKQITHIPGGENPSGRTARGIVEKILWDSGLL
jgi:hypothetical protein